MWHRLRPISKERRDELVSFPLVFGAYAFWARSTPTEKMGRDELVPPLLPAVRIRIPVPAKGGEPIPGRARSQFRSFLTFPRFFSPSNHFTMTRKISAFTLIELLIVITIIAVLAGIALPAYNGVKERGDQTKDLSNAKQIALALRQFAIDNNGSYPNKQPTGAANGDYSAAPATPLPTTSNDAFWWLFPNYLQSEQIFAVTGSAYTPANPDNKLDPTTTGRVETLKKGENNFAYVTGLTDTSNSTFPVIADGFVTGSTPANPVYTANKAQPGGVWAAKKAVVVLCDSSGQIMRVDATTKQVQRTNSAGTKVNMFAGAAADWFDPTSNPVLNPE
jgi:prepilin-type N-terminal cleavage/methylation domain-containing protein